MKIFIISTFTLATALLLGCGSAATEQEKRDFSRKVMAQDNEQQADEFNRAIDEDYGSSVGNTPAWEAPAN